MKIDNFLVKKGTKFNAKKHPTDFTGTYKDKKEATKDLLKNVEKIAELQDILYAQDTQSLLIIFQAMDAAGKDGTIKHVLSGVNPQGCHVVSFKQPSTEESDHDYLWRVAKNLPERGKIGVFNRSHYEEVLVVRVHPQILQGSRLPDKIKNDKNIWKKRYNQIRNFENHLAENGTKIIKFFLNVSKEEQKNRFLARIDEPDKNWKFAVGDAKERSFWNDYMAAYRDAIEATSTDQAPWYVIPADNKWFTRLAVSEVIVKTLESLKLQYPDVSSEQKNILQETRKLLEAK